MAFEIAYALVVIERVVIKLVIVDNETINSAGKILGSNLLTKISFGVVILEEVNNRLSFLNIELLRLNPVAGIFWRVAECKDAAVPTGGMKYHFS